MFSPPNWDNFASDRNRVRLFFPHRDTDFYPFFFDVFRLFPRSCPPSLYAVIGSAWVLEFGELLSRILLTLNVQSGTGPLFAGLFY